MGRRWIGTTAIALVLGVGALWFLGALVLRRVVAKAWTDAAGVPVEVGSARPAWPLGALRVSEVSMGAGGILRIAWLEARADPRGLLGGELRNVHIRAGGLSLDVGEAERAAGEVLVRRVAEGVARLAPWHLDSVRVDGATVGRDGEEFLRLGAFELRDVTASRGPDGPSTVAADLLVGDARGRAVAEIEPIDEGSPAFLVGGEIAGVPLAALVRRAGWPMEGVATARLWWSRRAGARDDVGHGGGDLSIDDLRVETPAGTLALARLRLEEIDASPKRRRLAFGRLELSGGAIPRRFVAPGPWTVSVRAGRVEDVRVDAEGADPRIDALELEDVVTDPPTGRLALDARVHGGRFEIEAERLDGARPGRARVRARGLSLPSLLAARGGSLVVVDGEVDADLSVRGPPGLVASGTAEARGVAISLRADPEESILRMPRLSLELARTCLGADGVRLRRAHLVEPELSIRRGEDGVVPPALGRDLRSLASPTVATSSLLAGGFGSCPGGERAPGATGVRVSGGRLELLDRSVVPPASLRLRRVEAVLEGPRGAEGPLALIARADGPGRASLRLEGARSRRDVSVAFGLDEASLRDFDPYLRIFAARSAGSGTFSLLGRARVRPDPAAHLHVAFADVALEPARGGDPRDRERGDALEALVRTRGGASMSGSFDLELRGDASGPLWGFAAALEEALSAAASEDVAGEAR